MYVPRTGELIRIVSNAAGTLTVVRGIGSTAAAINNGEELLAAGNAALEGDTARAGRSRNPTTVNNYTQIFRTPWEETDTALHTEYEADDDWDRQAADHGIEHAKNLEYAMMLGRPAEDLTDASGKPRRTTGGFNHFVTTNVTDFAGTTTELGFYTALRPIFRYGAKEKIGFASMLAVDVLNTFPRGKIQISNPDQNKYGLRIMQFVSSPRHAEPRHALPPRGRDAGQAAVGDGSEQRGLSLPAEQAGVARHAHQDQHPDQRHRRPQGRVPVRVRRAVRSGQDARQAHRLRLGRARGFLLSPERRARASGGRSSLSGADGYGAPHPDTPARCRRPAGPISRRAACPQPPAKTAKTAKTRFISKGRALPDRASPAAHAPRATPAA
jgi:hypothetical protein